jgi:hypothetical protein
MTDHDLSRLRRLAGNAVSRNKGDRKKAARELAQELVQEHLNRNTASPMMIALCDDYLEKIAISALS